MLQPRESLLLRSSHNLPVSEKYGSAVMIIGGYAEYVYAPIQFISPLMPLSFKNAYIISETLVWPSGVQ